MEFQYFDSSSCNFPRPKVPVLPPLTRQSLGRQQEPVLDSVSVGAAMFRPLAKSNSARTYSRGRYALHDAYRLCGVGEAGALLAPAYHCATMLDPAIRLKAKIDFYPLTHDLAPDLDAIASHLKSGALPFKALLVTHFFGFSQPLAALVSLCEAHGIALIEDCSHALFSQSALTTNSVEGAMGSSGRYVIASPYKFFPSEDGGLLWTNGSAPMPAELQQSPGPVIELKGILSAIHRARENRTEPELDDLGDSMNHPLDLNSVRGREILKPGTLLSIYYETTQERVKSLTSSRWIMRHTNVRRLANWRRLNYQRWVDEVSDLPHCHALLPILGDDCVPYMFPLCIDDPDVHFYALKSLGVPVWRWDDMAVSGCKVAKSHRLKLLHLPCHQELSETQLAWMIQKVSQVMHGKMTAH